MCFLTSSTNHRHQSNSCGRAMASHTPAAIVQHPSQQRHHQSLKNAPARVHVARPRRCSTRAFAGRQLRTNHNGRWRREMDSERRFRAPVCSAIVGLPLLSAHCILPLAACSVHPDQDHLLNQESNFTTFRIFSSAFCVKSEHLAVHSERFRARGNRSDPAVTHANLSTARYRYPIYSPFGQ